MQAHHDYKTRNTVLIQIVTKLLSGSHSSKYSHILQFTINALQKYCLKRDHAHPVMV